MSKPRLIIAPAFKERGESLHSELTESQHFQVIPPLNPLFISTNWIEHRGRQQENEGQEQTERRVDSSFPRFLQVILAFLYLFAPAGQRPSTSKSRRWQGRAATRSKASTRRSRRSSQPGKTAVLSNIRLGRAPVPWRRT